MDKNPFTRGFSRVELLIAVAFTAILGSIAVSETVSSRTRSDVARVRMDMRRVALALEAYRVDYAVYPIINVYAASGVYGQHDRGPIAGVWSLSTPVAYLTSVNVQDPFGRLESPITTLSINYINVPAFYQNSMPPRPVTPANRPAWYLVSLGPDRIKGPNAATQYVTPWYLGDYANRVDLDGTCHFDPWQYDPSNGTISSGDILTYPWRQ